MYLDRLTKLTGHLRIPQKTYVTVAEIKSDGSLLICGIALRGTDNLGYTSNICLTSISHYKMGLVPLGYLTDMEHNGVTVVISISLPSSDTDAAYIADVLKDLLKD